MQDYIWSEHPLRLLNLWPWPPAQWDVVRSVTTPSCDLTLAHCITRLYGGEEEARWPGRPNYYRRASEILMKSKNPCLIFQWHEPEKICRVWDAENHIVFLRNELNGSIWHYNVVTLFSTDQQHLSDEDFQQTAHAVKDKPGARAWKVDRLVL